MLLKSRFYLLILVFIGVSGYSQIGIGTITPSVTSVLDIESTTQGVLTPE